LLGSKIKKFQATKPKTKTKLNNATSAAPFRDKNHKFATFPYNPMTSGGGIKIIGKFLYGSRN
tara:strand:+ start:208 stop:396 length:189 start_codon:yes stop_codon:yes gene_type:complete